MNTLLLLWTLLLFASDFVTGQDQPGAIWMKSPHFTPGREGNTVKWLIIHGTAGGSSAKGVGEWFQNPNALSSTHYTVGQDGIIVQSVLEADKAWANGRIEKGADSWWGPTNPNNVAISIEHVKPSLDNSDELTEAQKMASFDLIRSIIDRNPGIKKGWADATGGITGHFSISPISRKRCPGPFPWEELFDFLNNNQNEEVNEESEPPCFATITATALNVRSEPNPSSTILRTLGNGQTLQLVSRTVGSSVQGTTTWFQVSGGGFVAGYYLQVKDGGPSWCK